MPLVTRTAVSGSIYKQATVPSGWANGDLWVDTDDSTLHINQAGTDVLIALGSLTAGDILYASADDTIARLAKGTAAQALVMNAGATAPSWATSGGKCFLGANGNGAGSIVGTVGYFVPFFGPIGSTLTATEAGVKYPLNLAGTAKNGHAWVTVNLNTNSCVLTLRKNGADTALVITCTALTTGSFTDTSNSVTVASGALLNWKASAGATGDTTFGNVFFEYDT